MRIAWILTLTLFFTTKAFAGDFINIVSMTPSNSSPIYVGQEVNVVVKIDYILESADIGSITLVIQKAEHDGKPTIPNESDIILRGSGTVILNKEFIVPETKGIIILTPLTPDGQSQSSIVQSKMYKVLPN